MRGNIVVRIGLGEYRDALSCLVISGIYGIRHIGSGKLYVGSAINMKKRLVTHVSMLNLNKHHSAKLQNAWNKYGASEFEFVVMDLVSDASDLLPAEQEWIDRLDVVNRGYNISSKAGSPLGVKHTEETRAKVSAALRGNKNALGLKHSPETKAKISALSTGRAPFAGHTHSEEAKSKMSLVRAGVKLPIEHRKKISCSLKGRKFSAAHCKKVGDVQRRFDSDKITEIRKLIEAGLTYKQIAADFQCSQQTICNINLRQRGYREG